MTNEDNFEGIAEENLGKESNLEILRNFTMANVSEAQTGIILLAFNDKNIEFKSFLFIWFNFEDHPYLV